MVALRVAVLTPSPPLIAWHRGRLRNQGVSDAEIAAIERLPTASARSAREDAVLRHVDRLAREPGRPDRSTWRSSTRRPRAA